MGEVTHGFLLVSPVAEHARKNASLMSRNDPAAEGPSAVGGELRDAREALGITVADMADALRIRAAHIEALEDGRFSELPGRPYTLGFARSIARHLGLDPDAVGMRLRDEVTGVARPVELVFPESTEDKRLSRAGWVAISLVLVAAAYGAWLTLGPSNDEGSPAEFSGSTSVPAAPPDIIPPAPDAAATAKGEVEDKTPETTVSATPAVELEPLPEQAPAASAVTPRLAPRAAPVPESPMAAAKPSAPAATSPAGSPPVVASRPAPPDATPAPAASAPAASESNDEEEDVTPEPSSVVGVPAASPAGRIMLRARQDSWVQIQAANGITVVARTLRAGEAYTVPEQPGLRLTTGNAGALDVIVDGQIAPALGQIGTVRRNVTLDPARLKAGTALE